jgi:hypothetical protein
MTTDGGTSAREPAAPRHLAAQLDPHEEPELADLQLHFGRCYSVAAFRYRGRVVWYAARRDITEDDVLEARSPGELKFLMRADHETRRVP